jgi:hypothetical protein
LTNRHRTQLVVSLGEGEPGARQRALLDAAATKAGLKVTVWARRILLHAAGHTPEEAPTRSELDALQKRVSQLEALLKHPPKR